MILIAGNKEIFRKRRSNIVQLLLIFTCCLVYGFTAVTIINCKYSAAGSVIYHSTILGKSYQGGRNPRYNLLLSNWGIRKKPSWIIVSAKEYESIEIQDQVTIKQYSGLLRIRWFTVEY